MLEKYLTLEQDTCAARIFLNAFGLTLESANGINEFSKLKIFDKGMNEVGKLHFYNGKVIMCAKYNNSALDANFDIAQMSGFVDPECESAPFALFGQWSSKINFQLQEFNNLSISGEFTLSCSVDTEFGITCLCHPLIVCDIPDKGKLILKMLREGSTFELEFISENYYEVINVRPWDWLNGFLLHDIKKGKYNERNYTYPYRRYAGVFNAAERGEGKNKLHVFLSEREHKKVHAFRNEFPLKAGEDSSKELLLQKGRLMQDLDPDMFEKIKQLRNLLFIGDVSLLDNLVSICYDSYTDEELGALLGLNRQKMAYQNGSHNLVNSYYEIGINNCFFPIEEQKRLLEKNK